MTVRYTMHINLSIGCNVDKNAGVPPCLLIKERLGTGHWYCSSLYLFAIGADMSKHLCYFKHDSACWLVFRTASKHMKLNGGSSSTFGSWNIVKRHETTCI